MQYIQTTPAREIVKQSSAFMAESVLLAEISLFAHKTSKQLFPIARNYFEYVAKKEPMACFAEGAIIEVPIPNIKTKPINNIILKMEASQSLPTDLRQIPSISHNTEEISNAIAKIEPNRIHHILTPETGKHAWSKICKNPLDWNEVKNIIAKVMLEGKISNIKDERITQLLHFKNEIIEVKYRYYNNKVLSIVNAWVQT